VNAIAGAVVRAHVTGSLHVRLGIIAAMPLVQHRYLFRASDAF
jgi:hypothetical protein